MKKIWLSLVTGALLLSTAPQAQAAEYPLHEYAEIFTGEVAMTKKLYQDFPGATIEVTRFERFATTLVVHINREAFLAADKSMLPEEEVALISLVLASTNPASHIALEITATIRDNEHTLGVAIIKDGTIMHKGEPTITPLKRYQRVINPAFTDIEHHANEAAIYRLARLGIVTGANQLFNPGDPISRAQFAVMLHRTIPNTDAFEHNPFSDLNQHWAQENIVTMYAFGIVKGLTTFNPGQDITRAQAAIMLARYITVLGIDVSSFDTSAPFEDITKLDGEAQQAIGLMYHLGIINGVNDTTFNPRGKLTRAQMAKILDGILHLPITN